jgi:tetratricopeptide (TPR) repeat protein
MGSSNVPIRRLMAVFLFFLLPLLFSACSFPRVMVVQDPLSPQEHLQLGVAYEKEGEYDLAEREYRSAGKLPEAHLLLGNLHFLRREYPAAEKAYKRAIRRMPENPKPRNNLAWLYYTQRIKLTEAEEEARRAVSLAPEGEEAVYRDTLERILEIKELKWKR